MSEATSKTFWIKRLLRRIPNKRLGHSPIHWQHDHWDLEGSAVLADLLSLANTNALTPENEKPISVSEFITEKLGRSANPGDIIHAFGLEFLILNVKSHRVGRINVYPIPSKTP